MMSERSSLVVGGGISGLVAARDLARAGWKVTIWEATQQWGGAVTSLTLGGVRADAGAEAAAVARPDALALIDELGLGHLLVEPRRTDARLLLSDGLVELPAGVLGIPADPEDPRLTSAISSASIERLRAERDQPVLDVLPTSTVGELVRHRLGDEVFTRLVDPVIAGVHAMSGDDADTATLLPGIGALMQSHLGLVGAAAHMRGSLGPSGTAIASLRGGMHTLTDALVSECQDLGVELHLGTSATSVERANGQWEVAGSRGHASTDALVLAIPPAQTARLLQEHQPELADGLRQVETTAVKVVTLVIDSEELDEHPVGPGVLVSPERNDIEAKAMTHSSAKWQWWDDALPAHRHVVRLSYGKAGQAPPLDDHLRAQAPVDARALTGAVDPWRVVDTAVTLWSDSLVRPTPGHAARMTIMRERIQGEPSLAVLCSALAGNGLAGIVHSARAESARINEQFTRVRSPIKEMST